MKKSITLLSGLIALAATTLSCQKNEAINGANQMGSEGKKVTITACIPEGMTKVSFTPNGDILELNWDQDNDKLTINGEEFSITAIDGKKATFTGNEPSGDSYTIVLNQIGTASLNTQEQSEDGNADHVKYSVALSGVDSYQDIEFSEAWAEHHHGSIELSGALRILAQLPSGVAQKVSGVNIKALDAKGEPANVFAGGNSIAVNLKEAPASGDKVNIYATLPAGTVSIPAGTQFFVKFVTPGAAQDYYTRYHEFTSASSFTPGKVNTLTLQCKNTASYAGKVDNGTEQKPYLIADKYQLQAMKDAASDSHYKLVDDIDLDGFSWTSLNADGSTVLNFDGNGKTISHLGKPLFTQINGTVSDLTITDAAISTSGTYYGILCRTINQGTCVISNVSIINSSIESSGGTAGGFIGRVETGCPSLTMTDCSATNLTLKGSGHYAGGLIGYVNVPNVSITRCHTSGTVTTESGSGRHVGGLVGGINQNGSVAISDSYSTCTIHGYVFYGGLVGTIVSTGSGSIDRSYATGEVSATKGNAGAGGLVGALETANFSITKSAAWNGKVAPPSGKIGLDNYSSGAVVGRTHPNCVLTDNYRNPAMELTAYWVPSANYDHPNVNGTTAPLVRIGTDLDESNAAPATETSISGDNGRWAYHGKHVAAGTTLSTLASTTLGWSTDVWDFSGSLPTLVNNPEN